MKKSKRQVLAGVVKAVLSAGGLITTAALAQQAPTGGSAQPSIAQAAPELEEVTVTAERRTEKLQNAGISAVVVTGQQMANQNLNSLPDLTLTEPSVRVTDQRRGMALFVRGIGSGSNSGVDPAVGFFVNDVYLGHSHQAQMDLFDVDEVQILKGPQTLYFGAGAIAGAFAVNTRKPTDTFQASARALYGQYGQYAFEGGAGGPVTDSLGIRVAGIADGQTGFVHNLSIGKDYPDDRNYGGRITALYHPTSDFDATLMVAGGSKTGRGDPWLTMIDCPPPKPFVAAGPCASALNLKTVPTGFTSDVNENPNDENLHTNDDELTLRYRHWNQTFTSVTAYDVEHFWISQDQDATPVLLYESAGREHYRQISQELRAASPIGGRFEYLAGIYYQHDTFDSDVTQVNAALATRLPPTSPLRALAPIGMATIPGQDENIYSAFGALTWNITDRLSLTGGARYSKTDKRYSAVSYLFDNTYAPLSPADTQLAAPIFPGLIPSVGPLTRSDKASQPSAKIQYQWTPDLMTYVSYTKGALAGGFNPNTTSVAKIYFAPETVQAWEAGVKSSWLAHRAVTNLALFHDRYNDLQVATNVPINGVLTNLVSNAATATTQGVEFSGQWDFTGAFAVDANVTYLDAHYNNYNNVAPTALQQLQFGGGYLQNLSGQTLYFAPKWSGNLSENYHTRLPRDFSFEAQVSEIFSSWFYLGPGNDPVLIQPGYMRLDAQLTLMSPSGRWDFAVIGKNLTDRAISTFAAGLPGSLGTAVEQFEMPRNVAFQVHYRW